MHKVRILPNFDGLANYQRETMTVLEEHLFFFCTSTGWHVDWDYTELETQVPECQIFQQNFSPQSAVYELSL